MGTWHTQHLCGTLHLCAMPPSPLHQEHQNMAGVWCAGAGCHTGSMHEGRNHALQPAGTAHVPLPALLGAACSSAPPPHHSWQVLLAQGGGAHGHRVPCGEGARKVQAAPTTCSMWGGVCPPHLLPMAVCPPLPFTGSTCQLPAIGAWLQAAPRGAGRGMRAEPASCSMWLQVGVHPPAH